MGQKQVKLFPFTIKSVVKNINETPEGVQLIQAPALWDDSKQGEGIVIAVIDTGIDTNHPDLKDRIIGGRNFTTDYNGNPAIFKDNNGHGTHVSGTIAASLNNRGVAGVAPKAQILSLKALTGEGAGDYEWIINAINYAVNWRGPKNERVRVMCMSLGGPDDVPRLHKAIQNAVNKNISVVVAAGNEGDGRENTFEYAYPAAYNEVISVGAVDMNLRLAPFTNTNTELDIVAPGVGILSTFPNRRYAKLSGTSMAAPHIAGALALIINLSEKEFNRTLIEAEVYAQLVRRTVPLGYRKSSEGNGFLVLNLIEKINDMITAARVFTKNNQYKIKDHVDGINSSKPAADADLTAALAELKLNKKRFKHASEYYDEEQDERIIKDYYQTIDFKATDKQELYKQLNQLITKTHENQLPYNLKTRNYLYSKVDLQMDGSLKSIYSGTDKDPEQVIRDEYEMVRKRKEAYDELLKSNPNNESDMQKAIAAIESENMYNCEHVVPQSWFDKDNPMRGDLHHLFTCEKACNSSRSNYPYFEFIDYCPLMETEAIRAQCGKYERGKFEPESGKGAAARATLYFLLRYPGEISQYSCKDIELLLKWHREYPVSIYEKHRNKEIFNIQKNRNPLIDFPQYADKIDFTLGLSL